MGEKHRFGSADISAVNTRRHSRGIFVLRLFFLVRNAEDDDIMTVMGDEVCKRRDYR